VQYAADAVPGTDGVGLALLETDHADSLTATSPFVDQLEQIQHRIGQGPAVSAAASAVNVLSHSLAVDPRWPHFRPRAIRLGVDSVLSIPLIAVNDVIGALSFYAHQPHAFQPRAAKRAVQFAIPAAIAVQNAQALAQAHRLAQRLQTALTNQAVIERAIGVLISQHGGTADDAYIRLRTITQRQHSKQTSTAQTIIDNAARHGLSPTEPTG
jgi:GAF domain-containing protein